jgi:hypothetical protein
MIPRFNDRYKLIIDNIEFSSISISISQNNESPHGAFPSTVYYICLVSNDLDMYEFMRNKAGGPSCDLLLYNESFDNHTMMVNCQVISSSMDMDMDMDMGKMCIESKLSSMCIDIDNLYNLSKKYDIGSYTKKMMRNDKIDDLLND